MNGNVPDRLRQLPPIAKHPLVMFSPTLEVEVAIALMLSPDRVVVPVDEIEKGVNDDVVANVVGDDVAM